MNRFLKNEWEKTEIPDASYIQARNRAWERIQAGAPTVRPALRWAAGVAFATLAVLLLWWEREAARIEPGPSAQRANSGDAAPSPPPQSKVPPAQDPGIQAGSPAARPSLPLAAARKRDKARAATSSETPERIVLNFVLPETGVRMIWISDSKFKLEGANE